MKYETMVFSFCWPNLFESTRVLLFLGLRPLALSPVLIIFPLVFETRL